MSFIKDLLRFKLIQRGDRVYVRAVTEADVDEHGWEVDFPYGWGVVRSVNFREEQITLAFEDAVAYPGYSPERGWTPNLQRVTDWQPAKGRLLTGNTCLRVY
jgi:hypothetical protein